MTGQRVSKKVFVVLASCTFFFLVVPGSTPTYAGDVIGNFRERSVKGDPSSPYQEFYEWNAFCSPAGNSSNRTCRTGACGSLTHDGRYQYLGMPNGPATIFCDQPNFFAAPKVLPINIVAGTQYIDTAPNTDYHVAFGQNMGSWGSDPWDWHNGTFYQTFRATGTGINRVSFKLAASALDVTVKIHQSNGGPVSTWPQVGPTRIADARCTGCDVWVAWRFGEVTTIPGNTYAVSYQNSGPNMGFFVRRDSLGQAYTWGTAYKGDTPQPYDLYTIIFSDNDGTFLTYQLENSDIGPSTDWAGAWAQSFTATGTSLAAVGLFAQNPNPQWSADVLIFDGITGGQQGNQVGPRKRIVNAGWYGPGTGYGGMSYNQGEVPLTPGRQYLIVISPYDVDGGGFNPLRRPSGDVLAGGTSYIGSGGSWVARPYDLSMSILEYSGDGPLPTAIPTNTPLNTNTPPPTNTPVSTPLPGQNLITNWSFEESSGTTHPGWTNNTQFGTNGAFPNPSVAYHGSNWASFSYGGGGAVIQDLYQQVTITPGHQYRLAAHVNVGGTNGTAVASLLWAPGGYPGIGNGTPVAALTWSYPDPFGGWTQIVGSFTPETSTVTVIIRAEINGWGGGVNVDAVTFLDQTPTDATPTYTVTRTPTHTPTQPSPVITHTFTMTPTQSPTALNDSDGDGIADSLEGGKNAGMLGKTNMYLPDSDGDGLGDGVEDSNRNGNRDAGETDPLNRDSDGDGYEDGVEVLLLSSNPLSNTSPGTAYVDSDGDGLPDSIDPNSNAPDSDGDRFLDGYEAVVLGLSAVTNSSAKPGLGDVDQNQNWDNADAQRILNFFAGVPMTGMHPAHSDLDQNAVIDNADAQHSLTFFAQLLPTLPVR